MFYGVFSHFSHTLCHCVITRGVLKYSSFLFMEHRVNHLFLNGSRC